ncbi:MAG: Zn-dependent alcohol dehydrogenase [Chloroflexota bacterium]
MKMKAAVLYQPKSPLVVEEVELDGPREGELLVRMAAASLCHTDLGAIDADFPVPVPIVLGHEGAGVVEQVGAGVAKTKPGDHVLLTAAGSCGRCRYCVMGRHTLCEVFRPLRFGGTLLGGQRRLHRDGQAINHFFMISSFAEYAVVPGEMAIRVREDAPLDVVCFLGCGGVTGIGSVVNTAGVGMGDSVAVFGCGGVGMNALMGARLVGAGKIIAVDILENKLSLARELGATHVINAARGDVTGDIRRITGGGADCVIVTVRSAEVLVAAFNALRPGGTCVPIAGIPRDTPVTLGSVSFMDERRMMGCSMGSVKAYLDIPGYIDLYKDGRLPLDKLITRRYPLGDINEAFASLEGGEVIKSVIVF